MLKILLAFSLAFGSAYAMSDKELANSINLAGKQRMLTQKMSKEALLIKLGVSKEENTKKLENTSALFDKTLKGLQHGDKSLELAVTDDKKLQAQLEEVKKLWEPFYTVIKGIYTQKDTSARIYKYIDENNLILLKTMNKAVIMYTSLGNRGGNKLKMANDINLAGKQRMITQKIGKDLLLLQANIEPKKALESLTKSVKLFDQTLKGLYVGDKELNIVGTRLPKIRKQLDIVKASWEKTKPLIVNAIKDKKNQNLIKEAISNLDITKAEMNKAVGLYAKSLNRQKQALKLNNLISGFLAKKNTGKHVINLAGKQRMLTQRISKLAIECTLQLIPESCTRLEQFINLYKKTLLGFKNGEKSLDLIPTKSKEALEQIDKILNIWTPFEDAAIKIQNSNGKDVEAIKYVLTHNEEILKESNNLVKIFNRVYGKNSNYIEKSQIKLVDIAGRQRMLTQKMTKEFLAIYKMNNKAYIPKLKKTITLFTVSLKELINGSKKNLLPKCTNPKIKQQLGKVSNLWKKIMPFYNKNSLSKKELVLLLKVNPILLKEMNKAVHLIETSTEY